MKKILLLFLIPFCVYAENAYVVRSSESFGKLHSELEQLKSSYNDKELNKLWKKANRIAEINDRCSSIQLTEKIDEECSNFFKVELPAFEEEFMKVSGEVRIGNIKIAKDVKQRAAQISACADAISALYVSKSSLMRLDGELTNLEPLDAEGNNIQADYDFTLSFDKKKVQVVQSLGKKWLDKCGNVILSRNGDFAPLFVASLEKLNDSISKNTDIDISAKIFNNELVLDDFDTLGGNYYINGKILFSSRGASTGPYLILLPQDKSAIFPEESDNYIQNFYGTKKFFGVSDFSGRWIKNTKKMEQKRLATLNKREQKKIIDEKKRAHAQLMNRYEMITDARDGKSYKTIKIGRKQWFAENLNFNREGSSCYANQNSNCNKLGRLYQWNAAKSACPDGWRLPTTVEFSELMNSVGNADLLKADNSNWNSNVDENKEILFFALPAGYTTSTGTFMSINESARFWSITEYQGIRAYFLSIENSDAEIKYGLKTSMASVRCVKK